MECCCFLDGKRPIQSDSSVLVIYTGGTIGMIRNEQNVLVPVPNMFTQRIREHPDFHDAKYAATVLHSQDQISLILPYVEGQKNRIIYQIVEYDPLLDSSNMTMENWANVAIHIKDNYDYFDGFVVLHGTDTLAYTSSALSFMLENLQKPVIVTGSQIPIFDVRSDGRDNFTTSLIIAGNYSIPEVCVFFGHKLFRGCRVIKSSTSLFNAFDSPNLQPLGICSINIQMNARNFFRSCKVEPFNVHTLLDKNVGVLRIFPSISIASVRAFLSSPINGVVLQTYGTGNMPSNRQDLINVLHTAIENGVIIVNVTQCSNGAVAPIYEAGNMLMEIGVLTGYDMTVEAALTKLCYVLGKSEWSLEQKKEMMITDLRGELTVATEINTNELDLLDAVARTLHMSSNVEMSRLCTVLYPAMVQSAVAEGDISKLNGLSSYGANLCVANNDKRTALHMACYLGKTEIVKYLLLKGCPPNVKDRYNRTPLNDAVDADNHEIITALKNSGATLDMPKEYLGDALCSAAAHCSLKRLESYHLAGADLGQADMTGRTALHLAASLAIDKVCKFLIPLVNNLDAKDSSGLTARDCAIKSGNQEVIELFDAAKFDKKGEIENV